MKVPEKIYVHIKDKPCEITFSEVIEKECSNIEYIRTDALIKKACEFLNSSSILRDSGIVEKFKNYIKGE